jgi:polysaccharide export outer membrane protein
VLLWFAWLVPALVGAATSGAAARVAGASAQGAANMPVAPAPTRVPAAPKSSASAEPGGEYQLGAGDLLRINVFGYPDMSADVRVDEAGSITYAYVGQLKVGGHSARDVETLVAQKLVNGGFIRSPQVSVLVADYRSQRVSVMGQVARPGPYPLRKASSVIDLLAEAGGVINPTAADEATLLRTDGSKISIDLYELFNGNPSQNIPVIAGDTIYVPKAAQFYIYGEVQRPGTYRLERNMTVSQAISTGGGLTPRGTERRATVKRRDARGKEVKVSVKGADLLQPDDVLLVKESFF